MIGEGEIDRFSIGSGAAVNCCCGAKPLKSSCGINYGLAGGAGGVDQAYRGNEPIRLLRYIIWWFAKVAQRLTVW